MQYATESHWTGSVRNVKATTRISHASQRCERWQPTLMLQVPVLLMSVSSPVSPSLPALPSLLASPASLSSPSPPASPASPSPPALPASPSPPASPAATASPPASPDARITFALDSSISTPSRHKEFSLQDQTPADLEIKEPAMKSYEIVDGGTQCHGKMLVDSARYSYTMKHAGKKIKLWICSVWSKSLWCKASIQQKGDNFVEASAKNPYAVKIAEDLQITNRSKRVSSIKNGVLVGFSPEILANLLVVKSTRRYGQRFDIKIDDVRFVGFPLMLQSAETKPSSSKKGPSILSFNVVFVLKALVPQTIVSSYQDLAKQLAVAIHHEEKRCKYLSIQTKMMMAIHDEVAAMTEDSSESPFKLILQKSDLAMNLKTIHDSLTDTGIVQLYINNWVHVNFCLPQKIYAAIAPRGLKLEAEDVQKCLSSLRPYHSMLLLVDEKKLLDSLPIDCTPALPKLIHESTPLKSLQNMALDADLSLSQVFQLVRHLVYWAKATVIYPLCESNVYVVSPHAYTYVNSSLVEQFVEAFPGMSLPVILSEFSLPSPLSQHRDVLGLPQQQAQKVQMVIWMLQRQLLMQLHTYVSLVPNTDADPTAHRADYFPFNAQRIVMSSSLEESGSLKRIPSSSDIGSVNSDESPVQPISAGNMSQSLSLETTSESMLLGEDWRMHEAQLTKAERESILRIPAAKKQDDLKLFIRLCPYFTGRHHLEEIMYYENVCRSKLLMLIDQFRDTLITCTHQDPATAFYLKT